MTNERFPMGFWNTQSIDEVTLDEVAGWAACGMTLTCGPYYWPGDEARRAKMLALLDECAKYGIRLILSDVRGSWNGASTDPEYRTRFAEAVDDFGHHPATFGFHVGDEPGKDRYDDVRAAIAIQREVAPHLTPYLNLLPTFDYLLPHIGAESYDDWRTRILPTFGLPILSFDCYTQMNPYGDGDGVEKYYHCLRTYSLGAKQEGIPLWSIVLSIGHFNYRCPNEDDIRWQLYSSIVHGAKGILWFYYRLMRPYINYRNPPVDHLGERTETYTWLSRQLRTFHRTYGDIMQRLNHVASWHVGRAFGGWPSYVDGVHPLVTCYVSKSGVDAVLSRFTGEDGAEYIAIFNNSQTASGYMLFDLAPAVKRLWRTTFDGEVDVAIHHGDARYELTDHIAAGTWLAPGQMELYRLEI